MVADALCRAMSSGKVRSASIQTDGVSEATDFVGCTPCRTEGRRGLRTVGVVAVEVGVDDIGLAAADPVCSLALGSGSSGGGEVIDFLEVLRVNNC